MAWLYREAPVNSIWEGSGNVMCIDLLRAIQHAGEALQPTLDWLRDGVHADARLRTLFDEVEIGFRLPPEQQQKQARRITQSLVLLAQASLMLEQSPDEIANAFIVSRCDPQHGRVYGSLPALDVSRIIARAWPY